MRPGRRPKRLPVHMSRARSDPENSSLFADPNAALPSIACFSPELRIGCGPLFEASPIFWKSRATRVCFKLRSRVAFVNFSSLDRREPSTITVTWKIMHRDHSAFAICMRLYFHRLGCKDKETHEETVFRSVRSLRDATTNKNPSYLSLGEFIVLT